jgi:hypothetical protein
MKTMPASWPLYENKPLSQTKKSTHCAGVAWKIAYALLWNGKVFTAQQVQDALHSIRRFFFSAEDKESLYEEFVQRVLMARLNYRPIPFYSFGEPAVWFSDQRLDGFASTKKWYSNLREKREHDPSLKTGWIEFAWAIWNAGNKKRGHAYHEWRTHFASTNQSLLNLFLAITGSSKLSAVSAEKENVYSYQSTDQRPLHIQKHTAFSIAD